MAAIIFGHSIFSMAYFARPGFVALLTSVALVAACSSSGKKVTDLPSFDPTASVKVHWSSSAGDGEDYFFTPSVYGESVFITEVNGELTHIKHGKEVWQVDTEHSLSAGVGTDGEVVVVASKKGDVLAYAAKNGKALWQAKVSSTVLTAPTVSDGMVLIRSIDNAIYAFDTVDGDKRWVFHRDVPSLEVRNASAPIVAGGYVMAGMPNGKLLALHMNTGVIQWEGIVTRPRGVTELDRIANVAARPVLEGSVICAAAYQGHVACFDLAAGGRLLWKREISSFSGLDISDGMVYVSDSQGAVHALNKQTGAPRWTQKSLDLRQLSAPTVVGEYVAVGDYEGVVHFLRRSDGGFAARYETGDGPIVTQPRLYAHTLIVQTQEGDVYALEASQKK